MTTTDGPFDVVAQELDTLEKTLLDTLTVMQVPGPDYLAALAAVRTRLPGLSAADPAAQLLRIRALTLDAHIAWCCSQDAATSVAGLDEVVALYHELIDAGGDVGAEAADRAVEACADTAMVFLAQGDLAAAQERLRRADAICQTCDVVAHQRLELMNAWAYVDFGYGRLTQALRRAEAAVDLGREVGGAWMVSAVLNLAQACRRLGDWTRAESLYGQALANPARTEAQDQSARMQLAVTTAMIDPARAVPLLLDVVERSQHDQGREYLAHAAATLGSIAQADGQVAAARHWFTVTARATTAPAIVAGGYILLANVSDPATAELLRRQARRIAAAESVELQVWCDSITCRDALVRGATEPETMTVALAATLVTDTWRVDLPWNLRESWQQLEQRGGIGPILRHAHDFGRHDLVAALAAHLCAIVPPDHDDPRPPRVLVAGTDPLAEVAQAAVERYDRPVRDEERTVDAYAEGLDLVAVDHGDVYLCWRRPSGAVHSVRVPHDRLDADLAELAQATGAALVPPAGSALLGWPTEVDLMRRLGAHLLPPALVADLERAAASGSPRLRVRADGALAGVPWGLLVVPHRTTSAGPELDTRLVELVDVVSLAPFGLPVPSPDPTTDGVVAVLDPRVRGFPADSALGSVLGRMPAGSALERRMRTYLDSGRLVGQPVPEPTRLFRRRDQDRDWLTAALSTRPARLLYLGHVSTVTLVDDVTSEPALHLCCSAAVPGNAAPLGAHRPLAASDVLAGGRWPPRVALIACASGDDARTRDAYGLAHAVLSRGARLVTGLLWPLPTGQWYHELVGAAAATDVGGQATGDDPLVCLTLAVDQAHETADPVRSLCQWQRHRLHRWRTSQSPLDSPISWGGLHTIVLADEPEA